MSAMCIEVIVSVWNIWLIRFRPNLRNCQRHPANGCLVLHRMRGPSAVRHSCATLNPDQPNARSPERAQRPCIFFLTLTYMDVGKPLNCHSRANSRDTGFWEMLGTTQGPKAQSGHDSAILAASLFARIKGNGASLASRSRGMIISTTRCCASRFACSRA